MIFFLHPIDEVGDGQVAKMTPLRNSLRIIVLLLLALGVLVCLFLPQQLVSTDYQQKSQDVLSTTEVFSENKIEIVATVSTSIVTSNDAEEDGSTNDLGGALMMYMGLVTHLISVSQI